MTPSMERVDQAADQFLPQNRVGDLFPLLNRSVQSRVYVMLGRRLPALHLGDVNSAYTKREHSTGFQYQVRINGMSHAGFVSYNGEDMAHLNTLLRMRTEFSTQMLVDRTSRLILEDCADWVSHVLSNGRP